jgi:hypothetical protein
MRKMMIICLLLATSLTAFAEDRTLRELFVEMPDSLLPYLSRNNRLDFIDFVDSGMKSVVTNELGGKSEMVSLTDSTLVLQVSPVMRIDMHLMPVREPIDSCNQVVCVLTTCGDMAPESKVEVYSVHWTSLEVSRYMDLPDEPYVADMVSSPSLGIHFRQMTALDPIAYEEQKKEQSWLKIVEWKQ